MKIAYIGIDLMLPILHELVSCGCEVLEVFTCNTDNFTEFNTEIVEYAESHKIRWTKERITLNDFERLNSKGCEAVFCAGYYHRIPVYSEIPCVNFHPALLPYGKGSWPMPYYILDGEKYGGMTIHKIAESFDTGDILIQKKFELTDNDNLKTYMEKAISVINDSMDELVASFDSYYVNAKPQKNVGSYLKAPIKEMYTVYSNMDVKTADLILRAFYGYECFYVAEDGTEYMLIKAEAFSGKTPSEDDKSVYFSLSDGFVVCNKNNVFKSK